MNILLLTQLRNKLGNHNIRYSHVAIVLAAAFTVFTAAIGWAGYELGQRSALSARGDITSGDLYAALEEQREQLETTKRTTGEHLDALALRLGQMQSHILRLDSLGERLVEIGNLDEAEFNFSEEPPRGGLSDSASASTLDLLELAGEMETLSRTLADREQKLNLLEELIMNQNLSAEIRPSGRPIKKGWISSRYGYRKDPFTGKRAFHHGVDFAGKKDSEVISVAAGVVTWVGDRWGYGNLIEINHGNGYITRYGHNAEMLVSVGEKVAKGQTIARMGSTGRSTGPHVHFEMRYKGRSVDPIKHLARRR